MPLRFPQTLQALGADRGPRLGRVAVGLAWVLLLAWLAWFFLAEVTLRETTSAARLEARQAALALEAPVNGEVVMADLGLDRAVEAGDILLRLDTRALELDLQKVGSQLRSAISEIESLRREKSLAAQTLDSRKGAAEVRSREAKAGLEEASARARVAESDADRAERLHMAGQLAKAEWEARIADAEALVAARQTASLRVERIDAEARSETLELRTGLARLDGEIAELEGASSAAEAEADRLRHEIERRTTRAPVAGRLAEVARLRVASMVSAGDRIATLLPETELAVVAQLDPTTALGRLRAGQPATVTLEGYPWTQYGSLGAEIVRVARESRYGQLRVELEITDLGDYRGPLAHGLSAHIAIDVERLTPFELALRAAGQWLEPRTTKRNVASTDPPTPQPSSSEDRATTVVEVRGHRLRVEVVAAPSSRAQGLMARQDLGEKEGMLFVFPNTARHSFWMRNTPLPLTAAFLEDDGTIVELRDMTPGDSTGHRPSKPVRYVLETRQGWFQARDIVPGDAFGFELPDDLPID